MVGVSEYSAHIIASSSTDTQLMSISHFYFIFDILYPS